jgi:hypothetical protein
MAEFLFSTTKDDLPNTVGRHMVQSVTPSQIERFRAHQLQSLLFMQPLCSVISGDLHAICLIRISRSISSRLLLLQLLSDLCFQLFAIFALCSLPPAYFRFRASTLRRA